MLPVCGTLRDLIKEYGGNKPKDYIKMLLEGVRRIHVKGYVYCNLKLNTIHVFCSIWDAKDSCFIWQVRDRTFDAKLFRHTILHPPECGTANKISVALDIWSLGCVVLQMITGKPLRGIGDQDGDMEIVSERMSSEGKDILMKCFAREASETWSAGMLLSHPFLVVLKPTAMSSSLARSHNYFLPFMEQLTAMLRAIFRWF